MTIHSLKGMRDILPQEVRLWQFIEKTARDIGNDVGIDHNTVSGWLSVLEASYISFLLRPHHKNFNKRLVKSPKLYFLDTGLLCQPSVQFGLC